MKKYTLEELIGRKIEKGDFPQKRISYYYLNKDYLCEAYFFYNLTVIKRLEYKNTDCILLKDLNNEDYYIPISELIRIGILEEQPKEIQFDIWN